MTINVYDGTYETVIAVVIHVASTTSTFEFGGVPQPDRLYDNGRVFGGDYNLDGLASGTWIGILFVGPTGAPTAVAVPVEIIYTP